MKNSQNNNSLGSKRMTYSSSMKHQKGAVLILAIVFLVVITIIGVSAIRMTGINTQVSGNSVLQMLTYQGAESALGKTAPNRNRMFNIKKAADQVYLNSGYKVDSNFYGTEKVSGGGKLKSEGKVQVEEQAVDCPINIVASSSELKCHIFRVDATTVLQGTGAKSSHTVGLSDFAPQ